MNSIAKRFNHNMEHPATLLWRNQLSMRHSVRHSFSDDGIDDQSKGSWFNFVSFVPCPAPKCLVLWTFVVNLPKSKTNPKRTQTNPIFRTTNPILSPKTRILGKFTQHFLCKTKPIYVIDIQIAVEYDMSEKVNYATCPAPTLRLFHKVGTVETNPNSVIGISAQWSMRLQKTLKMTNKANLKIDQMSVTYVLTNDYNRLDTWYHGKTKPIQSKLALKN